MKDGKHFGFGTTFHWEFFQMPDGYSVDDIEEIINHSYVLKNGELRSHRQGPKTIPEEYKEAVVYRERPLLFRQRPSQHHSHNWKHLNTNNVMLFQLILHVPDSNEYNLILTT